MAQFQLTIVSPKGRMFDGEAERLRVRTNTGDVSILAHHIDYAAVLVNCTAKIVTSEGEKLADLGGGMLEVVQNRVRILANSFEWK